MDNKIWIGAAYYPELWPEEEVERDIGRCRSIGINTLRVGEFAWSRMEPKEGVFDFVWLQKLVDKLYANGIATVMCTPTCTPPRWFMNKYPETRRVMNDHFRTDVAERCHPCKTSERMRAKNREIVTKMAEALAGRKGIIGWQIDNEIFPYSDGCYCDSCKAAFRVWLQKKFGSIEKLNKAWGMARWSLDYADFDAVEPPYAHQWKHPSLQKAWHDFQCAQIKDYVDEQAAVLHAHGCKNVGTDMMPQNLLSYYAVNEKLDVVQYNHYEPADALPKTAFAYDFLRCVKDKPFWVTETQVGWNGSIVAECGYRPVGNSYANTWLPVARGAEMNMYWLFRSHPNGHELAHGALFNSAGREYRVSDEIRQAAADFGKCGKLLKETQVRSKIALHYSHTAAVSFLCAPIVKGPDYRTTLIERYYAAFRHFNVDVIDTAHGLDGYDVVFSPFLAVADENGLKERAAEWVKAGGTWVVGPMSDIMDANVSKYTAAPYSFLEELAGVYTKYQKPVPNDVFCAKWADGSACGVGTCYDAYECLAGTESLAKYDGGEFGGLTVVASRKVGKGRVILVGSVLSHADLLRLSGRGPIAPASGNVILTERTGEQYGIIAVETENKEGRVFLDGEYTELITGKRAAGETVIKPYGVSVFVR